MTLDRDLHINSEVGEAADGKRIDFYEALISLDAAQVYLLGQIANGMSNADIASSNKRTVKAVEARRTRLVDAIDSSTKANARAILMGLIVEGVWEGMIPVEIPRDATMGLSPRQLQTGRLLLEGLDYLSIREKLDVSQKTLEVHVARLFSRLRAKNRYHAAAILCTLEKTMSDLELMTQKREQILQ